ncbi:hypothetical protein ACJIZ3_013980 [Penstemon smallii]|uniref:F-box domain-containing protein n=1 Tax=Penstemon smallii TaxID=265156 RepID=A0ABD3RI75_9LAMI
MDSLNKNNQLHLVETKNWADLPYDIIELVLKKLHFTAQIRFGAVCRSWQRVSKNCSTSCSYRRPWCEVFVVKTRICKNNGIVHNIYNICLSKDRVWSIGTPHISQNNHEITSVHYMKGKLYCLFEGGLLKSYTFANKSWEVLAPSLPAWINLDLDPTKCWLIEIGENLMTVCTSFDLENELKWSVFKFDWSRMSWILETSLKNTALFISGNISFSATLLDVNGENNLEDYRVNFFDDCHDIHEEHKLMYPKEYRWIEETDRVMTFIEPPYVRK